ncbi:hypothetical protein PFISCL1PPCAC_26858 [Pristionchus fissidentatus]|uniref:Uncharacterized protein n=1 Tax=Pristionchus fissidentatus TaxID=1538716 RepID=A0AAV5WU58_9BILA|nr:hypothetical protein PFISCL1PPCAC_26858 [Pristionchus fissidentatus]
MARFSSLALLLVFGTAIVLSYPMDDNYALYMKRANMMAALDAKNFPVNFGKRSPSAPRSLDHMAFRMNLGKRSAPAEAEDDVDTFEQEEKRMDKAAFRVGFGRR